jgi:plasminogen activator
MLFGGAGFAQAASPVAVAPMNTMEVAKADTSPVKFSLSAGAGYLTGEANEIVYVPELSNYKVSQLTWNIDNLFMVGVGAQVKFKNWLTLNFDGWFKATNGSGSMDDYDWQVPGLDWTDWSHHEDTDVTKGTIIDTSAEFAVFHTDSFALKLIGGYKWENFGWEAFGGDFIYSENGFRDTRGSFPSGLKVIEYEQTWKTPYFGVGIGANVAKFELTSRLIYSPFAQGDDTDTHVLRNLVTDDSVDSADMISFDIAGSYLFTNQLSLKLAYTYQKYDTAQGDAVWNYRDEGVTRFIADGAGMDLEYSLFTVALKYTF